MAPARWRFAFLGSAECHTSVILPTCASDSGSRIDTSRQQTSDFGNSIFHEQAARFEARLWDLGLRLPWRRDADPDLGRVPSLLPTPGVWS